ncbi:MAG: YiiX/YebB-like N1pC/P60 family cysteine hydrolase [Bacteroidales bacterium]
MKLKKLSRVIGACCFVFVLVLFYFIRKEEKVLVNEIDTNNIEDFDIILSKGQSVQSKLIGLLKFSIEDYSHVGIIIKKKDKIFVLHSTPDGTNKNGIRYDNLQTFFDLSDVRDYTILRYKKISFDFRQRLIKEFDKYKTKEAPFDFDFNNYESKKIYCSELVWLIFKNSGLFEVPDFNLSKPIYPKYFLEMNKLVIVDFKAHSLNEM